MNTRSVRFRLPPAPTSAPPGSPEKIRVLTERVRMGVSLWHPLDAGRPARASQDLVRVARVALAS